MFAICSHYVGRVLPIRFQRLPWPCNQKISPMTLPPWPPIFPHLLPLGSRGLSYGPNAIRLRRVTTGSITTQVLPATWQLRPGDRGIVVPPPAEVRGNRVEFKRLNPQVMREFVLLWDRIDLPTSNAINFGDPGVEEDILIREGILRQSRVLFAGANSISDVVIHAHFSAYRALDAQTPGIWTMAKGPGSLALPSDALAANEGVLFRLMNAIPIPAKSVSIEKVLKFKQKRQAELIAMRTHLEDLYQKIRDAPDQPQAFATEVARLDAAIAAQIRVSRESKLAFSFSGAEWKFNLGTAATVAAGAYGAASTLGLPMAAAALAGAAGATTGLKVEFTGGLKVRAPRDGAIRPFEYVSLYRRELYKAK